MKRFCISLSMAAITLALLSSCSLYTKPEVQSLNAPAKFKDEIKTTNKNNKLSGRSQNQLKEQWWQNFGDPQLDKLVNLALQKNIDYKIALKNIDIAKTYIDQNASYFAPQVNLNYSSARESTSKNVFNQAQNILSGQKGGAGSTFNIHQLDASVSYEIDFWHQIGNSVNQAKADTKAMEANSNIVKLSLLADIVNTYLQIVTLNENINNLEQQYSATNEIAKETNNQYKSGLVNIDPLADAHMQVEAIKNNINNLTRDRQILQNTLAYLCGEYPENFTFAIKKPQIQPHFAKLIPPELPSSMLLARPDIQSALYQVISSGYVVKENLANFFPAFSLTGAYGFSSNKLSNFLTNGSTAWNYGINALAPVFDYKLRKSAYDRSKLQFEAATLNYKNITINAFQEVDNALITYQHDYNSFKVLQRKVEYSQEKYSSARAQYKSGMINYAAYLSYKLAYLQNKYNLTEQNLLVVNDVVQIYKALGLGLENSL